MTVLDQALLVIAVVSAVLVIFPFAIYPLILKAMPSRNIDLSGTAPQAGHCALVFCAFNEAAVMPAKIENLRALKARYPDLRILAYDDGSQDGTGDMLAAAADILMLLRGPGRMGKAHGMKQLAAIADREILIFTDANVMLDDDVIGNLCRYYGDPHIGGVLGSLRYHVASGARTTTAATGGLYWRLEEWLKDEESRTGNVMGADGSIFSIRARYYPDFPDSVLDDLTVSMAVVFAGARLVKARDVIAREALVSSRRDEYRRKVRIAARSWHTHGWLRPGLRAMAAVDRFKYVSRKMLRWFGLVWIVTGVAASIWLAFRMMPSVAIALLIALALFVLLGATMKRGPVAALFDIIIAYIATARGISRAMRGATMATWAPAKSRNG